MKRKFKTLGLVLASVFAVSALGASGASAADFHSSVHPQNVHAVQTTGHVFTTNAGTFTCKTATFTGVTSSLTSETLTLTPDYNNCTVFGFINVPVHENGCAYEFEATGSTYIDCPEGKAIEITAPFCTTSIGTQNLATGVTYETGSTSPTRRIVAKTNLGGIHYNECGATRNNGTYTGTSLNKGSSGEIWHT